MKKEKMRWFGFTKNAAGFELLGAFPAFSAGIFNLSDGLLPEMSVHSSSTLKAADNRSSPKPSADRIRSEVKSLLHLQASPR